MVAQIKAVRKGLKIQKLAASSAPMNRTANVILVISWEADTFLFVIGKIPPIKNSHDDTNDSIKSHFIEVMKMAVIAMANVVSDGTC